MAITYTFVVTQLEIAPSFDGETDVVTRVRYNYNGVNEGGISGSFAGATPVPAPASGSTFIPFDELTQDEVIDWLEIYADKPHMQVQIAKQIENQIHPHYVPAPLPWDPQPSGSAV